MLIQNLIEARQNRDIEVCASILHEDFFYIKESTMETRDEWLEATAEMFESSDYTRQNGKQPQDLKLKIWAQLNIPQKKADRKCVS